MMQKVRKSILQLIAVPALIAILLAGTTFAAEMKKSEGATPSPSGIVAKVNGSPITQTEVDRAMKFMLAQSPIKRELTPEQEKSAEAAVMDQLISAELLYQAAVKLKIPDIEEQVKAQMNRGMSKFKTKEDYIKALKENDLTEKKLEDFARKEIYINNFIERKIASKATVSDADAKKFYEENSEKFNQPETIRASHILIGIDPKASDTDKKKSREKAESLLKRAKAGEDFATLAKENSTCPSAKQGGDLGYFGKGQMVPAFEAAAFSLKPGEVSEIVETPYGYHIIMVVDKKPAGTIPFSKAKQEIVNYLKVKEIQKGINDFVEKLRKEGTIEILKS